MCSLRGRQWFEFGKIRIQMESIQGKVFVSITFVSESKKARGTSDSRVPHIFPEKFIFGKTRD